MSGEEALVDRYDMVILDLDGVVYLVDQAIPGAAAAVGRLRERGTPIAFATNNASRRAPEVAQLLVSLGVPADETQITTSAGASAALLADRFPAGSPVLVVGAAALAAEVNDAGLRAVTSAAERPVAVVQGYGRHVGWEHLAEACIAIRAGAQWIATNPDRTLPSAAGPLPGNGSLVAALATALDRQPDVVVGKPEPVLFQQAALRYRAQRPLVVGDRLDTDIEGARRAGMDSMLVFTGVAQPADLLAAPPQRRPSYLAFDLNGLFTMDSSGVVPVGVRPAGAGLASAGPVGAGRMRARGAAVEAAVEAASAAAVEAASARAPGDGWRVVRQGNRFVLAGSGEPLEALRALCGPVWSAQGGVAAHGGVAVNGGVAAGGGAGVDGRADGGPAIGAEGDGAAQALRRLGLAD